MTPREQAIRIVVALRQTSRIYISLTAGLALRRMHQERIEREAAAR